MDSIIREYNGNNPTDYEAVTERFTQHITFASNSIADSTGQKLVDLLLLPYEPSLKTLSLLVQPWLRANMLINFLNSFKPGEEKSRVNDIIRSIQQFKKTLISWPKKSLDFLVFQTSSEPQIDRLLNYLAELETFLRKYSKLNFNNGEIHTSDYLKKYAIDSLLWMGKKMALKESGRPTQLNKYIHIVTDRLYTDINKDHTNYKKEENYLNKYDQNKNYWLMFIFNPECSVTKDILTKIRIYKNTRQSIPDKA